MFTTFHSFPHSDNPCDRTTEAIMSYDSLDAAIAAYVAIGWEDSDSALLGTIAWVQDDTLGAIVATITYRRVAGSAAPTLIVTRTPSGFGIASNGKPEQHRKEDHYVTWA